MKADLPKREPQFLAQWEKENVYAEALRRREPQRAGKTFILHDGPPYANGHLHLGHALNKVLKDVIVRYKTMAGFYAPYVPGWDCHGLPIELQLMKELKVTDKHKVDRTQFRAQAAAFAQKFVDIQRAEFKRMGVLGDWEHPYLTMAESFKKTIVDAFLDLQKKGYVYRGKKPVYWCSTDETALAEAEVEYENDPGPSIFVAFPAAALPQMPNAVWSQASFVIWTTTPWTLPANVAIAFNPDERYVLVRATASGKTYIVADKRFEEFQKATQLALEPLDNREGALLDGATARHPWIADRTVRVLPAGFVAMDTGTGLVHIAPGHGAEDFQLGQKYKLPVLSPVDDRGRFTDEVPQWQGLHVFKANPLVIEHLKSIGALLHTEEITHSYPHCWRCHRPVIFRATEQWFLNIDHDDLRKRLLQAINQVEWVPAYGKNRITGMVESRPDWCLSRQRLWGTEIPSESREGGDPDILDVWFESGVSWAAVLRQPSPWPDHRFPADLYLEGSDQHRGWFQTSLIPAVALEGRAPYKTVLTHGFVMDGQGRPMSKSLGNVIAPEEIIKQYGADVLRLWVGTIDYGGDVRLSQDILKQTADTYRKIRNTFRYLLGNLAGFDPKSNAVPFAKMPALDQWTLAKLNTEIVECLKAYDTYEFQRVTSRLVNFCTTQLSGFYLDVIKDRLYCDGVDSLSRRSAQTVLHHLADTLTRLWAPILSFTADESWRAQGHSEAVSLADMPAPHPEWTDPGLDEVFPVRDKVLEALERARQGGRIKGNLEAKVLLYPGPNSDLIERYRSQWASFCIVSQAEVAASGFTEADGDVNGIQIKVERADGQKCARCWIYKTDVGQNGQYPDICGRCADALGESPVASVS